LDKIAKFFQKLLSLSHAESKGFVKLLIICIVALALLYIPRYLQRSNRQITAEELKSLDSLVNLLEARSERKESVALFRFDPNRISLDSLLLLGLDQSVSQRLIKYRDKGGRFTEREDLKMIYGLSEVFYDRVFQFIDLPANVSVPRSGHVATSLNINNVLPQQLQSIPMIGEVLSNRIVKYRDALGGYISEDQFDEVYGLSPDAADNLRKLTFVDPNFKPKLLNINEDSLVVLKRHPYISDALAEDIVRFREINSIIKSEKVLSNFKSLDKSTFEKLILYLDFS